MSAGYRYTLTRDLSVFCPTLGRLLWVMLNPSTADETLDDPTIRKCRRFSAHNGYGSMSVVNLFAIRSTDPKGLLDAIDPIGQFNDATIIDAAGTHDRVIVAWGAQTGKLGKLVSERASDVLRMLEAHHRLPLLCIDRTKSGAPRHPLMATYQQFQTWDTP